MIDEARMSGATVHFASLMDICHLKNAELEAKHQKYKGRIVLRGDIVKDDSESHAVFTEQGSSASQMTAAKIMDFISRLPGCDGQAADAVSAYTQVKMEDLRNVTDLLSDGKTPYGRRFGQPFKGPIIPFGSLVEYHPITATDQSRIHQFGKKVLPGLFLGYALYAG